MIETKKSTVLRPTLKLARGKAATQSGISIIEIKIPGTPGSSDGRVVDSGKAWFASPHDEDSLAVEVVDVDGISGAPAGTVVATYNDVDVAAENIGWWIPKHTKEAEVQALTGKGFIPAGFYLRITGTKGDLSLTDTLYTNIKWGKIEQEA